MHEKDSSAARSYFEKTCTEMAPVSPLLHKYHRLMYQASGHNTVLTFLLAVDIFTNQLRTLETYFML